MRLRDRRRNGLAWYTHYTDPVRRRFFRARCERCRRRVATMHANGGTWWCEPCFDAHIDEQLADLRLP
jgi:PHP family Zn ribbon phosphoesterase